MDDIQGILYIVITIVFAIIGALGSKKKKKAPGDSRNTYNTIEELDFLTGFSSDKEEVPYTNNVSTEKVKDSGLTERDQEIIEEQKVWDDYIASKKKVVEREDKYNQVNINAPKKVKRIKKRRNKIDLRKAVIHSEILNAKYVNRA